MSASAAAPAGPEELEERGLANDTLDEDGAPLPAGEKNYLELYGVFPSLSVLRARFHAWVSK